MKRKILIVDDNQSLVDSLIELLERQGYQPEPADDLTLARSLYHRNRPDLVLLDCDVRGRDGLELISDFRSEPPAAPVIVMTARDDLTIRTRCIALGAQGLLNKPFRTEELVSEVQRILIVRYLLAGDSVTSPLRLLAHRFPKLLRHRPADDEEEQ